MADDFQSGICSGSWWNTQRSGAATGFDASAAASASCSTAITDAGSGAGSLSWSTAAESAASGPLTDPSLQISGYGLSPSPMDWNQPLLRSGGGAEPSFHALLQETPPFNYFRHDPSIEPDQVVQAGTGDSSSSNLYKDISQTNFLLDQHHHHQQQQQQLSSGNESGANYGMPGFPAASYGCPSTVLQGLFESDNKSQQSFYQPPMIGYSSNDPMAKLSQFLKSGSSPPKQQSSTNHLNFANNAPFWNPSVPSLPVQFGAHSFEQKPSCSNLTTKSNPQGVRDSCSSATKKSSSSCSSEPALKKPRIETPSPLPTFKVRKEKLGDRITALQQLVSPFGKTDTASVLHEAIEYIKFLHEQVSVLSTPYLKNGHPMQHHEGSDKSKDGEGPKQDLRSRGLCLVPVASTYPVASETNADFWTPTFGGTYR